jgi:Ca-activated chloride channel family protein
MMFPRKLRTPNYYLSLILALIFSAAAASSALADGIIIPDPPPLPDPVSLEDSWLTVRYHRVSVTIEDQIAVTRVEQEFLNEHDWEAEGTYIFPLPDGATISEFTIWADGIRLESEILPADQARKIYEDIVRERRDPALLEYIGTDAVRARIFPIPPGGSRIIELEYSQVLEMEDGLVRYRYPLNTEKFSARSLEECAVRVDLVSPQPLRGLYSPTHQDRIDILREGQYQALVGYEEYDVLPEGDFELIYTVSQEDVGLNLLTYPDLEGQGVFGEEGFFMLLAAPSLNVEQVIPRDIILVLDTSGSMEGGKLDQVKEAVRYVLNHLNPEDRFNVIAFSTGVKRFSVDLQSPSQASRAVTWIESMQALGGTNINQALLEALTSDGVEEVRSRPQVVLFLTDGLPTEGVTEVNQILANVRSTADSSLRLFSFGVGDDVNTELLDTLAEDNRGLVSYVRSGERIDEEVSSLFAKIQTPVLSDLEIDFGGILVEEIYPPQLPDLFAGSQLLVVGRYRLPSGSSGKTEIRLTGRVGSRQESHLYRADFKDDNEVLNQHNYIPRLWAARKIGYLLNQIRHQGENQEWVDAVIQLSLRYGIITPYTSFLMTEDDLFYGEGRDEAAQQLSEAYSGPASGAEAVDKADSESNLREAESVPRLEVSPGSGRVGTITPKQIGDKSFFYQNGVWIDSQYDSAEMEVILIEFGSAVYFQLLDARPEWGSFLALGDKVIFVSGGKAYQITPDGGGVSALPEALDEIDGRVGGHPDNLSASQVWRSLCSVPLLAGLVLVSFRSQRRV